MTQIARDEFRTRLLASNQIYENRELGLEIVDRLQEHFRLLYAWNDRINLTSIRDQQVGFDRHLVEALAGAALIDSPSGHLVDLGSGNGYPGLAVLLLHERLRGTLVEKTARKVDFLRAAIRDCGVGERVDVLEQRVESVADLPPDATIITMRGFPEPARWIARAFELARVDQVLGWLSEQDLAAMLATPLTGYRCAGRHELGPGKLVVSFRRS